MLPPWVSLDLSITQLNYEFTSPSNQRKLCKQLLNYHWLLTIATLYGKVLTMWDNFACNVLIQNTRPRIVTIYKVKGESSHLKHSLTYTRNMVSSMQLLKKLTNRSNFNNNITSRIIHALDSAHALGSISLNWSLLPCQNPTQLLSTLTAITMIVTDKN